MSVRLYGIDASESNQPGGSEATAALKPLQGQTVAVEAQKVLLLEQNDFGLPGGLSKWFTKRERGSRLIS
jgi:uncharacterized iron-regulated membrane protein